jgi:hypothetical protein
MELALMKHFNEFHDGWFQGLWIDGEITHLFLATEGKERFVMVAEGTEALAVDGVKAGNIIFEVLTRDQEEILPQDIDLLYGLQPNSAGRVHGNIAIEKARLQKWSLLEINPSYGATCLVLASSLRILTHRDWLAEYGLTLSLIAPSAAPASTHSTGQD